jgi:hypothetical protein
MTRREAQIAAMKQYLKETRAIERLNSYGMDILKTYFEVRNRKFVEKHKAV